MGIVSIIWGVLAMIGAIIAFTPCLGALNWVNIPFSVIGLIFGVVAVTNPNTKNQGSIGCILNGTAIVVGIIRLFLGGGWL